MQVSPYVPPPHEAVTKSPRSELAVSFQYCTIASPRRESPARSRRVNQVYASTTVATAPASAPKVTQKVSLTIQLEQCQSFADFNHLWKTKQTRCSADELIKFLETSTSYRNLPHSVPDICDAVKKRFCEFSRDQMVPLLAALSQLKQFYGDKIQDRVDPIAATIETALLELNSSSNEQLVTIIQNGVRFNMQTLLTHIVSKTLNPTKFSELSGSQIVQIASAINSVSFANLYETIDKQVLQELVQKEKLKSCSKTNLVELAYVYRHFTKYRSLFNAMINLLLDADAKRLKECYPNDLALLSYTLRGADSPKKADFYKATEALLVSQLGRTQVGLDACFWIADGFRLGHTFTEPLAGLIRTQLIDTAAARRPMIADSEGFHLASFAQAFEPLACPEFFKIIEDELCRFKKLPFCSGTEMARLATSFSNRGALSRNLKDFIARMYCTTDKLQVCTLDQLGDLTVALNGYSTEFYKLVDKKLRDEKATATATAKQLLQLASGFASSAYPAVELYKQINYYITAKQYVSTYCANELVALANAYKGDMEPYKELFDGIRKMFVTYDKLSGCTPTDLAEVLNIFKKDDSPKLHQMARALLLEGEAKLVKSLDRYTLCRMVEGFSHSSAASNELFKAFEARFFELLDAKVAFSLEDLTSMLHAFARGGFASSSLFDTLDNALMNMVSGMTEHERSDARRNLFMHAWSLACIGRLESPFFTLFSDLVTQLIKTKIALHSSDKMQLAQIALALRLEAPDTYKALISTEIEAIVKEHKEAIRVTPPDSSRFHLEISRAIKDNFSDVEIKNEFNLDGLALDIWLPGKKRAVEVNGPTHYVEDGNQLNGVSRFKMRLVEKITKKPCVPISGSDWKTAKQHNAVKKYIKSTIIDPIMQN